MRTFSLLLLVLACANPLDLGTPPTATPTPAAPAAAPSPGPPPPSGGDDLSTGVDHAPDGLLPLRPDRFCAGEGALAQEAWERFAVVDGATECDIGGWVADPDPAGLNVRESPDGKAKVLRTIPREAGVRVVGAKNGWLLVCGVSPNPDVDRLAVSGWVHASKLQTGTRGYERGGSPLRAAKDPASAVVATVPVEQPVQLVSCDGSDQQVRWKDKEGWLAAADACPNNFTSCPM